jgi:thiol-disulfide isomerase/thioredoxin
MKASTIALLVAVSIAACTVASAAAETNLVGSLAPAPVLINLDGGYQYLSHFYYEGNEQPRRPRSVVVLNFMGLQCAPCRKELPLFLEVVRPALEGSKKAGLSMRFYLVSTDPLSAKDELRKFLIGQKIDPQTEVLLDPYRKAAEKFGVSGIPRTLVISQEGRITADITGAVDDYKKRLQDGIETAMKPKDAE